MLLNEFFGKAIKAGLKGDKKYDGKDKNNDELFWYIIDHDKLHKDMFLPLAQKIKKQHAKGNVDKEKTVLEYLPMVNKGCSEYYKHKKMTGKIHKLFPEALRKELCEKLFDHYNDDIIKDHYSLGL